MEQQPKILRLCPFQETNCNIPFCQYNSGLDCLSVGDFIGYAEKIAIDEPAHADDHIVMFNNTVIARNLDPDKFNDYVEKRFEYYLNSDNS